MTVHDEIRHSPQVHSILPCQCISVHPQFENRTVPHIESKDSKALLEIHSPSRVTITTACSCCDSFQNACSL